MDEWQWVSMYLGFKQKVGNRLGGSNIPAQHLSFAVSCRL